MPNIHGSPLDLLTLTRLKGIGPVRAETLLSRFGSAEGVFGASASELGSVEGIGPKTANGLGRDLSRARKAAEKDMEQADAMGARLVGIGSPEYPRLLSEIPSRPLVLFVLGSLPEDVNQQHAVGIVGSRRCSVSTGRGCGR